MELAYNDPDFWVKYRSTIHASRDCFYTGYKGRKAVYEIIPIDHDIAENIKGQNIDENSIAEIADFKTLSGSAFELFKEGETTIEEIYSILINS